MVLGGKHATRRGYHDRLVSGYRKRLGEKDYKHSQGKLYLSEILLCGVLFALKGGSFRQFYAWLSRREWLLLPERTRLQRLLIGHQKECDDFLADPTFFTVMDSYGVEVIHPRREHRSKQSQQVSSKGKSNDRWIVGRKINIAVNDKLEVIRFTDATTIPTTTTLARKPLTSRGLS